MNRVIAKVFDNDFYFLRNVMVMQIDEAGQSAVLSLSQLPPPVQIICSPCPD